jgi:hypothetical protein
VYLLPFTDELPANEGLSLSARDIGVVETPSSRVISTTPAGC